MVSFKIQIWGMQMLYKHTYDNAKLPYSTIKNTLVSEYERRVTKVMIFERRHKTNTKMLF